MQVLSRFSADLRQLAGAGLPIAKARKTLDDLDTVDLTKDAPLDAPDVPGRVVFKGTSSYWAKEGLKMLGGYWDPPHKRWLVPEANEVPAKECIKFAKAMGRLLTGEEAEAHLSAVREGLGIKRRLQDKVTCFECGKRFTTQQILDRGGVPAEWYCGCCEEKNLPARRAFGQKV